MAKKNGRPTKYLKKMDKLFEDSLAKGYSKEATCGIADIHCDTMYEWKRVHASFSEAIRRGESKSIQYFERLLLAKTSGQKIAGFNAKDADTSCLIFALKTRFHKIYGARLDVTADISINNITDLINKHSEED